MLHLKLNPNMTLDINKQQMDNLLWTQETIETFVLENSVGT